MKTKAIILAAGQGKRMRSSLHKLLHPVLGRTVIKCVVDAALEANIQLEDITVVISPGREDIKAELTKFWPNLLFAIQEEPLGTGHAAQAGIGNIQPQDNTLILCGDMPLVTGAFIKELLAFNANNPSHAVVTALHAPQMKDFGRVYFDDNGMFNEIVEARDLKPTNTATDWVNTAIYLFKGEALISGLKSMNNNNSQNEYYLTDVPKIIKDNGNPVRVFQTTANSAVFTGINTQQQLSEAVSHMKNRINLKHMENGVRMIDPSTVYIDSAVEIAQDVTIYPNVILEGCCKIDNAATIGANTHLVNTHVGKNAHIRQSELDSVSVGDNTTVGPFAYLRPGTVIGNNCRIGNFVEVKNSNIGNKTAMAHLAYIGDADVGEGVNYSCGAITANYDGKNKHRTTIKDGAFIGSNANLIAPITIGQNAFVAAGSTLSKDLPPDTLGIARARQEERKNWKKPQ